MFRPILPYLVITLTILLEPSFTATLGKPTRSCSNIFREANLSQHFAPYVVHAIHSINVEALREFEPDFDALNFIPNVDLDLLSTTPILPHAPIPDESDFKTQGMRVLDQVLSHMSNPSWEIKNYNTVERLVHKFHMQETWYSIRGEYEKVKSAPPSDEVCQCALDEQNNGIMKMLKFMTLTSREPELICGNADYGSVSMNKMDKIRFVPKIHFYRQMDELRNLPRIHLNDKIDDDQSAPIASQKTQIQLDQSDSESLSLDDVLKDNHQCFPAPALEDEAAWKVWRGDFKRTHDGDRDAAVYLYCAHKRANQFKKENN